MVYRGAYPIFNPAGIKTYPLRSRQNRAEIEDMVDVAALRDGPVHVSGKPWFRNGRRGAGPDQATGLRELADYIVACRQADKLVAVICGAHPVKNGQIAIISSLIDQGIVTSFSTNGATTIHSFEMALTGASSESVREALPNGDFGMAFETGAYLNYAIRVGWEEGLGYGEAMGRLICDAAFRRRVLDRVFANHPDTGEYIKPYDGFAHADVSVFTHAYRKGIPICVHASLGTDIIDQHASYDPESKGGASGADFLVFAEQMCRFTEGGVILNIGTAIMGPEVVLKAVSMAANAGFKPDRLWTADFDIRPFVYDDEARDESQPYYYLRDQKSIATRIPKVFNGIGFYFEGLHEDTLPPLYQCILHAMG